MFSHVLRDMMNPLRADVIETLKLSDGLAVGEISKSLGVSYMGVKQHCQKLVEMGYASEHRVPRAGNSGRPRKLYRLTEKCDDLFPACGAGITIGVLEAAKVELGANAAEKLLFRYFAAQRLQWAPKVRKMQSMVEKCTLLTDLRREQGVLSRCQYDPERGFRIEEHHNALDDIFAAFPTARAMEERMLSELLGCPVRREMMELGSGRQISVLLVNTLG